jgi:tetratricopeptide (TPR) repeat protein
MKKSALGLLFVTILTASAHASSPQWIEIRSPHFTLISDANEKQARHTLDQLERMRWVFQTMFPSANVDPAEPILVIGAKDRKTFQTLEPAPYLGKGQLDLAGYFLRAQDRNYILLRFDANEEEHPFATIYHEYTHLQFREAGEWMPIWLNEGIAEFFQNTDVRNKDVLVGKPDADNIAYLRSHQLIPLPVLFKVDASSPYYHDEEKGSVFYAESWALTHYLQINDRVRGTHKVQDYLRLVKDHEDTVEAAEKVFGDLKQLQSALDDYTRLSLYRVFVLNSAAAPIDETSYTVRPMTQIEADAARADVLVNVKREKEARDLIETILKEDQNNVAVRVTMGQLEYRLGDFDLARKWFGEAAKLDPTNYLANYYYASISMDSGHSDDSAIEPGLRAAIQNNPKFAYAYERLAAYLGMQHQHMDLAVSLITTAIKLEPGNFYFRLNASNIFEEAGDYKTAGGVAGAALKLARNPQQVSMAQGRIDGIEVDRQRHEQAEQLQRVRASEATTEPAGTVIKIAHEVKAPQHPEEANGPKHTVQGVIRGVTCGYPELFEMKVVTASRTYVVYSNNLLKIELSVLGFTPTGPINACSDFEGRKARVQYAESVDKTVDGKVFAIELRK